MPDEIIEINGENYVVGYHVLDHQYDENPITLEGVIAAIENAEPEITKSGQLMYIYNDICAIVEEDTEFGLHVIVTAFKI